MNKKINYINSYNKDKYKMYQFRIKRSNDALINKLDNLTNRNHYIENLVLEDIDSSILTIKEIKDRIRPIVIKYKIKELYLFGSYARGEANRDSDIDLYGDTGNAGGFESLAMADEFKEVLNKEVDFISIGSELTPLFREELNKDKIKLFDNDVLNENFHTFSSNTSYISNGGKNMISTRDRNIIFNIIKHSKRVMTIMKNISFKEFDADELRKESVCINILQISELAKSLSREFIKKHNEIPWKKIKGNRDIIAHGYGTINFKRTYKTCVNDIPVLLNYLENIYFNEE